MTVILHSYTDSRSLDQIETLHGLVEIAAVYGQSIVHSRKMTRSDSYDKYLAEYWNKTHTIINIEQDIVAYPRHIEDLLNCKYDSCCFPYMLADGRWSIYHNEYYGDRELPLWELIMRQLTYQEHYNEPFPKFAQASSLGLVKIGRRVQRGVAIETYDYHSDQRWKALDGWISCYMADSGLNWHVHSEVVTHNHKS